VEKALWQRLNRKIAQRRSVDIAWVEEAQTGQLRCNERHKFSIQKVIFFSYPM
jgi:hypothetical protein